MENPVAALATECLNDSDGNWERAARALRKRINRNPEAKADLFEKAFDQLCWIEIRHAARKVRELCITGREGRDSSVGLEEIAKAHQVELLDYPLRGGLKLTNACQPQLAQEMEFHGKLARTNGIKERWLRLIHDTLPDDGTKVGSLFTNEKLLVLHEKAEAAIR